jgi:hypothetical protein
MAKGLKSLMNVEKRTYQGNGRALNQGCTEGSGLFYAIFFMQR